MVVVTTTVKDELMKDDLLRKGHPQRSTTLVVGMVLARKPVPYNIEFHFAIPN